MRTIQSILLLLLFPSLLCFSFSYTLFLSHNIGSILMPPLSFQAQHCFVLDLPSFHAHSPPLPISTVMLQYIQHHTASSPPYTLSLNGSSYYSFPCFTLLFSHLGSCLNPRRLRQWCHFGSPLHLRHRHQLLSAGLRFSQLQWRLMQLSLSPLQPCHARASQDRRVPGRNYPRCSSSCTLLEEWLLVELVQLSRCPLITNLIDMMNVKGLKMLEVSLFG